MADLMRDSVTDKMARSTEILAPLEQLRDCTCCPRECHSERFRGKLGYCGGGSDFEIASICAHQGEEPVISGEHGICNIFFSGCNLTCLFCQNFQISRKSQADRQTMTLPEVIRKIEGILDSGSHTVGFVSPSHYIPQVKVIINALHDSGRRPGFVYNTNAYDKVETIKSLDGSIDVWLPDLKYLDEQLARLYSNAPNYPEIACAAVREMYAQKGSNIRLDDNGQITSGLIIRHLVLPGQLENSKRVLRWIAEELSPSVHVSLMSQYNPTPSVAHDPQLGRTLRAEEYSEVLEEFEGLGFYRGWRQELDSSATYQPDFTLEHPFER
jgi:putative pyruvate formate lyase activating enzyme